MDRGQNGIQGPGSQTTLEKQTGTRRTVIQANTGAEDKMIRAQMIARNVTNCTSRVYVLVCRGKSRVFEAGLMIGM